VSKDDIYGPTRYRLVVYSVAQRNQRVIVSDLPGDQAGGNGQRVDWNKIGIIDSAFLNLETPNVLSLFIYDKEGKTLFSNHFDTFDSPPCNLGNMWSRWVNNGKQPVVYFCDDTHQFLLNPISRELNETSMQLELYSSNAPNMLSLFPSFGEDEYVWHLANKGQVVKDIDTIRGKRHLDWYALDKIAISPDGQQVAYLNDKGLVLYDLSGQATPVPIKLNKGQKIAWIGWGPTDWRMREP
jgi:hypothetical protein